LVLKTNVVGASSLTPEGWSRSILDFGLEGAGEPIEEVDATLPGCASDGQHSFHESAAALTVGTEGYFPPEHSFADGELGGVGRSAARGGGFGPLVPFVIALAPENRYPLNHGGVDAPPHDQGGFHESPERPHDS